MERRANQEFDRWSGGAGNARIDSGLVQQDLADLESICSGVKLYANKLIAHRNIQPLEQIPSFEDLDRALDKVAELAQKYLLIFRAGTWDLLPKPQHNWKVVFREPWIPQ